MAPIKSQIEPTQKETGRGIKTGIKRRRTLEESLFVYNASLEDIFLKEGPRLGIEQLSPKRPPVGNQGPASFCIFHKEAGHDTQGCRRLKKTLDGYAAKGYLHRYLCLADPDEASTQKGRMSQAPSFDNDDSLSHEGFIAVISGGLVLGGPTSEGRQYDTSHSRTARVNLPHVEISEADYRKSAAAYDDEPLVLEIKVANLRVKRVLVDTGSSSDIVSLQCLQKLQHDPKTIEKVHKALVGFGGSVICLIGSILLPVLIGTPPVTKQGAVRFIIVSSLTSFNIILGCHALNDLKAMIVPHLLLIKFVGSNGDIGAIYGNQQLARDCYLSALDPAA
ncbi:uncharacterized protein [Spinacia oleracea]|uniref:Peptidase A2 domain-containing protein n=1 Tax=Spinacia oleracea TaxID=3562 RepID=A0A9R0JHC1_SPIOL|nr:uncharacterized protein LOC110805216 [Spinacia oleracea]